MKLTHSTLLFLFMLCSVPLLSRTEQIWKVDMMSHRSVHITDSNLITITSLYNRILRSDDGGQTFSLLHTPKENAIVLDAYFIDSLRGVACGMEGYVVRTANAGKSWEIISPPISTNFIKMYFSAPNNGYIIGNEGVLLHTTDSGKTWREIDIPTSSNLTSITHNGIPDNLIIGTANGAILVSHDNGLTWEEERPLLSVVTVAATGSTIVAVSGRNGTNPQDFSVSFDGGKTWNFQQFTTIPDWGSPSIRSIIAYDSLFFRAAVHTGLGARVITTNDAGQTWQREELEWPFNLTLAGVTVPFAMAVHGDKCIVVGENSLIMYHTLTEDNTPLWKVRSYSGMRTRSIESDIVQLGNGDIIFGNSRSSTIVSSRDGGVTWLGTDAAIRQGNSVLAASFRRIQFVNDSIGYFNGLATSYLFYSTSDGGNSLSLVRLSPPEAFFYNAFEFLDTTSALIFDINGRIRHVTTDGVLKNMVVLDSSLRFEDSYRIDEETVCAIAVRRDRSNNAHSSFAYLVDNQANNVREIPLAQGDDFTISKVHFFTPQHGIITGHENFPNGKAILLYTEDAGQTWSQLHSFEEANYGDYIQIIDDTTALVSAMNISVNENGIPRVMDSYVFFTQDRGRNWRQVWPLEGEIHRIPNQSVMRFQILNDSIVMAFSNSTMGANTGEILYANINDLREVAVSVGEEVEQRRGNPYLYLTVHPNPVRATAHITLYGLYSVPPGRRSLKVYDLLGNQVADISDQIQNLTGGFATTEWNTAAIARGQYLVVFSDGNDARTRNVIVIE